MLDWEALFCNHRHCIYRIFITEEKDTFLVHIISTLYSKLVFTSGSIIRNHMNIDAMSCPGGEDHTQVLILFTAFASHWTTLIHVKGS